MPNHRPIPTRRRAARRDGFTLIELLVAISIIILLIGITFPVISALQNGSRIEAGLNTIGMSADIARQWVAPSRWANDGISGANSAQNESYSGCAALYCPNGEIRIITNFRNARDPRLAPSRFLEDQTNPLNGYRDRQSVDYISIPNGVGVVGIVRTGAGANNVELLAPPFAIAFDEFGHMFFGDQNGLIYYDSDRDGRYNTSGVRPNGYDPAQWDGATGSNNAQVISEKAPVRELPFEAIECVAGLIIYDANQFADEGFDFSGGGSVAITSPAANWLQANGEVLFFSPQTGIALRDEKE